MTSLDLSRRALLGAGGGLAAGLVAPDLTPAHAGLQGSLPRAVDVVVVGGGLSGLVTARSLARRGREVLLVEARNRVGGRVLNHHLESGGVIESGGAFVGPTQNHILRLARELDVPTFKEYVEGDSVYVSQTTGRVTYQGTVPPDPTILPDAANLLTQINEYAAQIPVDAPWTHPRAGEWDTMTLREWIQANAVNGDGVANLIECWTEPGFGADPSELSFLYVLWYVACSGNERHVGTFERNSETSHAAQERRFVGGSGLIPERLARQLGDVVALRAPVHRIVQRDDRVVVHTGRGPVRAKRVVVACPPPLVLDIDWHPQLPRKRQQLLRHLDMGQLMKCDAVYETPFWREAGLNGFGLNDSGPVRVAFDNSPKRGEPGVLLAFVGGATWREFGIKGRRDRRRAVLDGLAAMFGEQALSPIEYTEFDWNDQAWTGGGPVANYAPGTMTSFGQVIRRRFGRVHWAGTETSTYWTGYMDGAVRAGQRAAAEVLEHR